MSGFTLAVLTLFTGQLSGECTLYGGNPSGRFFTIDATTGVGTLIGNLPVASTEIQYDAINNKMYSADNGGSNNIREVDISDGSQIGPTLAGSLTSGPFQGMEFIGNTLYVSAYNSLFTFDPTNGDMNLIGTLSTDFGNINGLAYDAINNVMYGSVGLEENLYQIDVTNANAIQLGQVGVAFGSIAFYNGILYASGN